MVARWKRRSDNAASWKEHPYQAAPPTPSDCKVVAMDGGAPVAFCSLAASVRYRSWFSKVGPLSHDCGMMMSQIRRASSLQAVESKRISGFSCGTVDEPLGPPPDLITRPR